MRIVQALKPNFCLSLSTFIEERYVDFVCHHCSVGVTDTVWASCPLFLYCDPDQRMTITNASKVSVDQVDT